MKTLQGLGLVGVFVLACALFSFGFGQPLASTGSQGVAIPIVHAEDGGLAADQIAATGEAGEHGAIIQAGGQGIEGAVVSGAGNSGIAGDTAKSEVSAAQTLEGPELATLGNVKEHGGPQGHVTAGALGRFGQ